MRLKIKFFANLLGFFIGIFKVDLTKKIAVQNFNLITKNKGNIQTIIEDFIQIISTKNIVNDNPLLTTLKAYFIIDALNGKIIENEYSKKVLNDILMPKVKK